MILYHGTNINIEQIDLGLFKDGYIDLEALTKALAYRKLNSQYFFGTQKAIHLLRRV